MGNSCGSGAFGRVFTAEELMSLYPDNVKVDTEVGVRSGLDVRRAFVARQIGDKLGTLQMLFLIYFVLVTFCFLGLSIVQDWAQIPLLAGVTSVPHTIWGIWPYVTIYVYLAVSNFGPYFQVARVTTGMRAFHGVLLIDIMAHIAHEVFVIIELVQCSSALCTNANSTVGYGTLIALTAALGLFIVWQIIIWVVSANYERMLVEGLRAGWEPGAISTRNSANVILDGATKAPNSAYAQPAPAAALPAAAPMGRFSSTTIEGGRSVMERLLKME